MRRLLVIMLSALVLTACGGDEVETAAPSTTSTTVEEQVETTPDPEVPTAEDEAPDAGAQPSGEDAPAPPGEAPPADAGCEDVMGAVMAALGLAGVLESDSAEIDATIARLEDVAHRAPAEIREPFGTVSAGYTEVLRTFRDLDVDLSDPDNLSPEQLASLSEVEAAMEQWEDAGMEDDLNRVVDWMTANCEMF